eukprot:5762067-Pyramimonas_sp.AAC.1
MGGTASEGAPAERSQEREGEAHQHRQSQQQHAGSDPHCLPGRSWRHQELYVPPPSVVTNRERWETRATDKAVGPERRVRSFCRDT